MVFYQFKQEESMVLVQFEKNKQLDPDKKLWIWKDNQTMYIRAEDPKHPLYGCPAHLMAFIDQYIWEVGPSGKKLHIGNVTVA